MNRSIAFYAPLKSPNHPTPSGDRTIARGLMNALSELGDVDLVSELRTRDGMGDAAEQAKLIAQAEVEITRFINQGSWDAWVTYHNYYKAPDLIGPVVCEALNIPYHLIEASRSPKRLDGPWARFAKRAEAAIDAAQVVYYSTQRDFPLLKVAKKTNQDLVHLKPFLDRDTVPALQATEKPRSMLAVGMFRGGDKVASYANLAAALRQVSVPDWTLDIVGSGDAEVEIQSMFAPFGSRVRFLGELTSHQVLEKMEQAKVFVWPGVNEAFGMVYLEAQAVGTPVVAEDRIGVRDVVGPVSQMVEPQNAQAFAEALDRALQSQSETKAHQKYVSENHLRGSAVQTLARTMAFQARVP
jgi:glycosyltransferase involved in cell wall biosynthesis